MPFVSDSPNPAPDTADEALSRLLRLWRDVEDVGPNPVLRAESLLRGLLDMVGGVAATWALVCPTARPSIWSALYVGWEHPAQQSLANHYLRDTLLAHPLVKLAIDQTQRQDAALSSPGASIYRAAAISDADWYASDFVRHIATPLAIDDTIQSAQTLCRGELLSILHVYRAANDSRPFGVHHCLHVSLFHDHILSRLHCNTAAVDTPRPSQLSPRQQLTFSMLLSGDSEKQIAAKLDRSRHTVHMHVKAIYRALKVSSRAELLSRFLSAAEHQRTENFRG